MAYIRRLPSGNWQATVRLPDGRRRSATRSARSDVEDWARLTELQSQRLAAAAPKATFTWTPAGLDIHVPEDLLTMDTAARLEQALRQIFEEG
jgi:hypothetical protein